MFPSFFFEITIIFIIQLIVCVINFLRPLFVSLLPASYSRKAGVISNYVLLRNYDFEQFFPPTHKICTRNSGIFLKILLPIGVFIGPVPVCLSLLFKVLFIKHTDIFILKEVKKDCLVNYNSPHRQNLNFCMSY